MRSIQFAIITLVAAASWSACGGGGGGGTVPTSYDVTIDIAVDYDNAGIYGYTLTGTIDQEDPNGEIFADKGILRLKVAKNTPLTGAGPVTVTVGASNGQRSQDGRAQGCQN